MPALEVELGALLERYRACGPYQDDAELIERTIAELTSLRRQLAIMPARTNLLMMSAAIASELAGTYDSIDNEKTRAHIALLSVQLALKLEELVPR